MNKKAAVGDLIGIPIKREWFIGLVKFVLSHSRDIMLMEIHGPFLDKFGKWESAPVVRSVYTGSYGFQKGGWLIVGRKEFPTDNYMDDTLRIVADKVWIGDRILRQATAEDRRILPYMDIDGHGYIEDVLHKVIESRV